MDVFGIVVVVVVLVGVVAYLKNRKRKAQKPYNGVDGGQPPKGNRPDKV